MVGDHTFGISSTSEGITSDLKKMYAQKYVEKH